MKEKRYPIPPFNMETAQKKVKLAEDAWNTKNPEKVASGNRIAVRFEYKWSNSEGQWFRSYGNENWEFDEHGLMSKRYASINDIAIDG